MDSGHIKHVRNGGTSPDGKHARRRGDRQGWNTTRVQERQAHEADGFGPCGSGEHTRLRWHEGARAYSDSEHEANRGGPRDGAHAADHVTMASCEHMEEERTGVGGTRGMRAHSVSVRRWRAHETGASGTCGMRAHTESVRRWRARETGAGAVHMVLSARWCRSKVRLG
jgi:hypothetical protein